MFKETLLISPKLSNGDLNNMERSLQSRFTKVAKGFGKGLLGVLGGAGVVGLVGGALGSAISGIYDRLVAPLRETQSAIERTLNQADDIDTQAKAFGSTSGQLARVQAIGSAAGLQPGEVTDLITKFQLAVAEAAADPNKQTSVRQFAGETNAVTGFFDFIQSLNATEDANARLLSEQEVFGAKMIKKSAELIQRAGELGLTLGGPNAESLTKSIDPLAALSDKFNNAKALRGLNDFETKSKLINGGVFAANEAQAAFDLQKENDRIANYKTIAATALTAEQINKKMDDMLFKLADIAVKMTSVTAHAKGIAGSPVVRLPGRKAGEM